MIQQIIWIVIPLSESNWDRNITLKVDTQDNKAINTTLKNDKFGSNWLFLTNGISRFFDLSWTQKGQGEHYLTIFPCQISHFRRLHKYNFLPIFSENRVFLKTAYFRSIFLSPLLFFDQFFWNFHQIFLSHFSSKFCEYFLWFLLRFWVMPL